MLDVHIDGKSRSLACRFGSGNYCGEVAEKIQGFPDLEGLLNDFKASGKALTLAARMTGPAETAFPEGPPKPPAEPKPAAATDPAPTDKDKAADPLPAQVKSATQPINVIAVADTDMLSDRFWVDVQDFVGQRIAVRRTRFPRVGSSSRSCRSS